MMRHADWRHDDAALDRLLREASDTVKPPADLVPALERLIARADSEPVVMSVERTSFLWRSPLLGAAAMLALLILGHRVQQSSQPPPTAPRDTMVAHGPMQEQAASSTKAVVTVTFPHEHDAIVVPQLSDHPNVTILWVYPIHPRQADGAEESTHPDSEPDTLLNGNST